MSKKNYIKHIFKNLTDTKVKKVTFTILSIGLILLILFGVSKTNFVQNLLKLAGIYTQEEKVIKFYSDGWEENDPGSIHVTKSADWVAEDTAEITFNIESKLKTNVKNIDVILAIDTSEKYNSEFYNIINEVREYANSILDDSNNRLALISFNDTSSILTDFTNDKSIVEDQLNSLTTLGDSNYYLALKDVESLLMNYTKDSEREVIVLLLADGYSSDPKDDSQYDIIKEKYSYVTINGISYRESDYVIKDLETTSDNQYNVGKEALSVVLSEASLSPEYFESFVLSDYIDSDFFVESEDDMEVSIGNAQLTDEDGIQKVTWTIPSNTYRSGNSIKMNIKIKLDSKYTNTENYYATNQKEIVVYNFKDEDAVSISSTATPVLKNGYKVLYDANPPTGCNIGSYETQVYNAFKNVALSNEEPSCEGFAFAGWEIATDGVNRVNENEFIMPTSNVDIKGTWKKLSISKSMEGQIYVRPTYFNIMKSQTLGTDTENNIKFNAISSDTNGKGVYTLSGTENDEYPIYYYRGAVTNNNVLFANFCWKMVRTTETGGVKLIYNGVPSSGTCNNTGAASQLSTTSVFNNNITSVSGSSYMMGESNNIGGVDSQATNLVGIVFGNDVTWDGTKYTLKDTYKIASSWESEYTKVMSNHHYTCLNGNTSCTSVYYIPLMNTRYFWPTLLSNGENSTDALNKMTINRANTTSSDIKIVVDNWFKSNLVNYLGYLEDAVWCNDISITQVGGWNKDTSADQYLHFGPYTRMYKDFKPTLECPNVVDQYRVSNAKAKLTYPVGLLTIDEISLAGASVNGSNSTFYLYTGQEWWTLSPSMFGTSTNFRVTAAGGISYLGSSNELGVRPAISLAPGIQYTDGDGSVNSPYVVETK